MWNKPSAEELRGIPGFYATEKIQPKEKMIYQHFFLGVCDWYICEYSPKDQIFFGFVILNNDFANSEWGYIDFRELCEIDVGFLEVDRDLHFTPTKAMNIERIRIAQGW